MHVKCAFPKTVYIFHDVVGREEAKKIRKVARLEVIEKKYYFHHVCFWKPYVALLFYIKNKPSLPALG